jgi:urease accessory protein
MPRPRPAPTAAPTLLRLMQLASPALPVGGFSYSEGLESAVDTGLVGNEAQAGDCASASAGRSAPARRR